MRREQTPAEQRLWQWLRAERLDGAKFRRQEVTGAFIADVACRSPRMLVVEVDRETHAQREVYDAAGTAQLKERGYRVLRFTNADVMTNLDGVLLRTQQALQVPLSPGPLPSRGEGERTKLCRST